MDDLQLSPALYKSESIADAVNLSVRIKEIDYQVVLVKLLDTVTPSALYFLADEFSVLGEDGWTLAESDYAKRQLIKSAIELHRYKGTPWAIREVFRGLDFGEIEILEGIADIRYDGQANYNGYKVYGGNETSWAVYRIVLLSKPITNDQAVLLRKILKNFAPARCHLQSLDYQSVPLRYNANAVYNGTFNYGSA